jgi:TRAP-type C4-dicarboxylate transport system permease small subunit
MHFLNKILRVFCGVALLVSAVWITCATVSRYFFNKPFTGVEEICGYLTLFICFMLLAACQQDKMHINVPILIALLPEKVRVIVEDRIAVIIQMILTALFTVGACIYVQELYAFNISSNTILKTPQWIVVFIMSVGLALLFLQLLIGLFKSARSKQGQPK